MVSPFFGPEIGEDQKKSLCRKIAGFLVQMRLETKQNKKTRSLTQIREVMVSHHNMESPQNGVTRGRPPPRPSYVTVHDWTNQAQLN